MSVHCLLTPSVPIPLHFGNVYDSDDPDVIDVWITAGRDQSNILKNMVDQQFTPTSKETYGKEIKSKC